MSTSALALANAAAARRAAAAILREGRFHAPSVPRPLHGLLHAIGAAASSVGRWVGHVVDRIGRIVPGGPVVVWILLGLALIAAIAMSARRYARRGLEREQAVAGALAPAARERAEDLEREAARAERDGRYADAVRLRFRAGLAALAERGAISPPRSVPTAELARTLRSKDFDALARRFDEIAYGAAPAAAQDAEQARRGWSAIVTRSEPR